MSLRYIRGGFTTSHEYVCLSCRLQCSLSQARQKLRRQHTSTQSADSTHRLLNGADPALPSQADVAKHGLGDKYQELSATLNTLPARKAKQLQLALQQKFLEKRRQEKSTSPAPTNADVVLSSEVSKPLSRRNKKKDTVAKLVALRKEKEAKKNSTEALKTSDAKELKEKSIAKRVAQRTEDEAKKASAEAQKASDTGKLKKGTILPKKKTKKAKRDEKLKDGAKKAGATTRQSGPEPMAKLKSDVAELNKALKSKTEDKRNLTITDAVSNLPKEPEVNPVQRLFVPISDICELQPLTASDIPKSPENENGCELKITRNLSKKSKVNAVPHLSISMSDISEP